MKRIGRRTDDAIRLDVRRPSLPPRRELLLYVEDDDDNWEVAALRLRNCYEILRAPNAKEACKLLARKGRALSAILMDIELRGSELNGIQLTQLIRGKITLHGLPAYARGVPTLQTPIIFVTAHGARYSDTHLLLAGGDKVISKPVDFGALNVALTQLHLSRISKPARRS